MIASSTTSEGWKQRKRDLTVLAAFGLTLVAVGVTLPWLISGESPTPMPYSWPAHHALYLHTDGAAAQCTVDDGVTEPFTITIPDSGDSLGVDGKRIEPLDHGPATVRCAGPVTADLDPGIQYALAGSPMTDTLGVVGGFFALVSVYLFAAMRATRTS